MTKEEAAAHCRKTVEMADELLRRERDGEIRLAPAQRQLAWEARLAFNKILEEYGYCDDAGGLV